MNNLEYLLRSQIGLRSDDILRVNTIHQDLLHEQGLRVSRAVMAQAVSLLLFADLLERVPEAKAYFNDKLSAGELLMLDHGALRTIASQDTGTLPCGTEAITRVLEPLGFRLAGDYPLGKLNMHGQAYAHADYPEHIAQYFVSELYPDAFSDAFQTAANRIAASSNDPLGTEAKLLLAKLHAQGELTLQEGVSLLPQIRACFDRHHRLPTLAEYQALLSESAEMAWIATEGNAFNHATDRVDNVEQVMNVQRELGRSAKDQIEVSSSRRVRQSALKAAIVQREMRDSDDQPQLVDVPGSFFEFISRDHYQDVDGIEHLDLRFDSSNAQGIFKMTNVRKSA